MTTHDETFLLVAEELSLLESLLLLLLLLITQEEVDSVTMRIRIENNTCLTFMILLTLYTTL
jgi:Trp operon repressor